MTEETTNEAGRKKAEARFAQEERRRSRFPRVAGNDVADLYAIRRPRYSEGPPVTVMLHDKNCLDRRAILAIQFAERWALVAAEPDGEDSAGRQKLRRMTPQELANAACDAVDALMAEYQSRGWTIDQPSYEEFIDAVKDGENAND